MAAVLGMARKEESKCLINWFCCKIATAEAATACVLGGSYAAMPNIELDELALRSGIAFRDPADLTFADCNAIETTIADLFAW